MYVFSENHIAYVKFINHTSNSYIK